MPRIADALERHQVPLYVAAIAVGAGIGVLTPGFGGHLGSAIMPVLGVLLYVTFLQVPIGAVLAALRDTRFLGAILTVDFVVVPVVVAAMVGLLPTDHAIRVGALLVLLTPCIDYVVVFAGLAGGDRHRLLAVTPVLLLLQMVLLPGYLLLFLGEDLAEVIDPEPFATAFVALIVIPLASAAVTQAWAARRTAGARFASSASVGMVPLMMLVLALVVAAQVPEIGDDLRDIAVVVPFYVAFLLVMLPLGALVGRVFGLDVGARRAVVFSGATRNSLVVLPLALALPEPLAATAAAVVVTQTLVEVVGMVIYLRVVPRLVPQPR